MWLLQRRGKRAVTTIQFVKLTFFISLFTLCCVTFLVGTNLKDSFSNSYVIRIYSTGFDEDSITPTQQLSQLNLDDDNEDVAKKKTFTMYPIEYTDKQHESNITQDNGNTESESNILYYQSTTPNLSLSRHMYRLNRSGATVKDLGPPISKPKGCHEPHCMEFLTYPEKLAMENCIKTIAKETKANLERLQNIVHKNDCNFMNGKGRHPVALISTEGSGNTWVRGLLEQATGICTGFLYCDYVMRMKGFIGENVKSGSVLVVKTHTPKPQWYGVQYKHPKRYEAYYGAAIFIIRNPYDALIAEWNRRVTNNFLIVKHLPHNESHTNVVPKEYWSIPEWDDFMKEYMTLWKSRIVNWILKSDDHPVHIVRYEDLKRDVAEEVGRMLTFLKIPFNEQELPQRLKSGFTMFKRRHNKDNDFERYSAKQMEFMRKTISDTIRLVQKHNKTEILQLEDYLLTKQ